MSILSSLQDQLRSQGTNTFDTGTKLLGTGSDVLGKGSNLLGQGVNALNQPLSYYQGLLGNRQEALTAAAPEISTIQGQYNTAARAVSEFSPRGGGRVAQGADLPFTKQAAIQDVITKQRPMAAEGVTKIGQLLSTLGLSEQQIATMLDQLGIGSQQLSANTELGLADIEIGQQAQSSAALGNIGSSIGGILAGLFGL
jgi:hypothetical protein